MSLPPRPDWPRPDWYEWPGGREPMLRFGPDDGPVVVAAPALLEEGNRTRALLVAILRGLANRGIGGVLPDLPGTGDSLLQTETATIDRWRTAFESLTEQLWRKRPVATSVAIRGGALLDGYALLPAHWQLAPMTGVDVRDEWMRVMRAAGYRGDAPLIGDQDTSLVIAGNCVSPRLWSELTEATPFTEEGVPLRVVRLSTDPRPADARVDGPPLWRRTEPAADAAFARLLADDIADWIATCAG